MPIDWSADDAARWGVRSAKAFITSASEVDAVLDFCNANRVEFLVARCPADAIAVAHRLENRGMNLMDTLVFFSLALRNWVPPELPEGVTVRPFEADELNIVEEIARESFRGYAGHYHADPRLDRAACDAVYVDWSIRLTRPAPGSTTLVAILDGEPAGYMSFRWSEGHDGQAVLGGVLERARKRGVYRALLAAGLVWLREQGAGTATVSSQIVNNSVQKVWTRLGFEPRGAQYTFHGWF